MPICMGILCERCRTVYFVLRSEHSRHIQFDRACGDFRLTCDPPCSAVIHFHRSMLRPYSIPDVELERGYADMSRCKPIK